MDMLNYKKIIKNKYLLEIEIILATNIIKYQSQNEANY